eukprot:gene12206-8400_t
MASPPTHREGPRVLEGDPQTSTTDDLDHEENHDTPAGVDTPEKEEGGAEAFRAPRQSLALGDKEGRTGRTSGEGVLFLYCEAIGANISDTSYWTYLYPLVKDKDENVVSVTVLVSERQNICIACKYGSDEKGPRGAWALLTYFPPDKNFTAVSPDSREENNRQNRERKIKENHYYRSEIWWLFLYRFIFSFENMLFFAFLAFSLIFALFLCFAFEDCHGKHKQKKPVTSVFFCETKSGAGNGGMASHLLSSLFSPCFCSVVCAGYLSLFFSTLRATVYNVQLMCSSRNNIKRGSAVTETFAFQDARFHFRPTYNTIQEDRKAIESLPEEADVQFYDRKIAGVLDDGDSQTPHGQSQIMLGRSGRLPFIFILFLLVFVDKVVPPELWIQREKEDDCLGGSIAVVGKYKQGEFVAIDHAKSNRLSDETKQTKVRGSWSKGVNNLSVAKRSCLFVQNFAINDKRTIELYFRKKTLDGNETILVTASGSSAKVLTAAFMEKKLVGLPTGTEIPLSTVALRESSDSAAHAPEEREELDPAGLADPCQDKVVVSNSTVTSESASSQVFFQSRRRHHSRGDKKSDKRKKVNSREKKKARELVSLHFIRNYVVLLLSSSCSLSFLSTKEAKKLSQSQDREASRSEVVGPVRKLTLQSLKHVMCQEARSANKGKKPNERLCCVIWHLVGRLPGHVHTFREGTTSFLYSFRRLVKKHWERDTQRLGDVLEEDSHDCRGLTSRTSDLPMPALRAIPQCTLSSAQGKVYSADRPMPSGSYPYSRSLPRVPLVSSTDLFSNSFAVLHPTSFGPLRSPQREREMSESNREDQPASVSAGKNGEAPRETDKPNPDNRERESSEELWRSDAKAFDLFFLSSLFFNTEKSYKDIKKKGIVISVWESGLRSTETTQIKQCAVHHRPDGRTKRINNHKIKRTKKKVLPMYSGFAQQPALDGQLLGWIPFLHFFFVSHCLMTAASQAALYGLTENVGVGALITSNLQLIYLDLLFQWVDYLFPQKDKIKEGKGKRELRRKKKWGSVLHLCFDSGLESEDGSCSRYEKAERPFFSLLFLFGGLDP